MRTRLQNAVAGCLLGTAVGDAIGLPCEGLSRSRQHRLFGPIEGHRLFVGRGMVSDDTEHAALVAQALIASAGDPERFTRALGREIRRWFLLLPAGVGWATLRAALKMLLGFPPTRSGVFSAGNGPAMRAPLLGVCCSERPERLRALVRASTRITHTDPKAEYGALVVALAAHSSASGVADARDFVNSLAAALPETNEAAQTLRELIDAVADSVAQGEGTSDYAARIGLAEGVSGYIYHTVPVAVHAWLSHPRDLRRAVLSVIACGGDTDTTAAIVGGIVGAGVGRQGVPPDWVAGLAEWPRGAAWFDRLAESLSAVLESGTPQSALPVSLPALALRNLLFVTVILYHGFRRLLPPY